MEGLDDPGHTRALAALRAMLAAPDTGPGVTFASATWIITARTASDTAVARRSVPSDPVGTVVGVGHLAHVLH